MRKGRKVEPIIMEDKITVIIPCYNAEHYIDRCLASVAEQTIGFDKLEIICVNDASTDGTWGKLSAWEKRYPHNIMLINCQQNGAQGKARNIGLSHASGNYITFLDADDWIEKDAYERAYLAMKEYNCDIVRYGWIRDNGTGNIWDTQEKRIGEDYLLVIDSVQERRKFLVTDIMDHLCVDKMYTAEFIRESRLSFPERCKYEDIYWGVLAYYYAGRVCLLNEIMYHYYVNPVSTVMTTDIPYHMDRFYVVRMLWQECERRGLLKDYRKETELNFIIHYYLNGLKMMALCYSELKYGEFKVICQRVREIVPQYRENPYIKEILSEMEQLEIALIGQDISQEEFAQVMKLLRG